MIKKIIQFPDGYLTGPEDPDDLMLELLGVLGRVW